VFLRTQGLLGANQTTLQRCTQTTAPLLLLLLLQHTTHQKVVTPIAVKVQRRMKTVPLPADHRDGPYDARSLDTRAASAVESLAPPPTCAQLAGDLPLNGARFFLLLLMGQKCLRFASAPKFCILTTATHVKKCNQQARWWVGARRLRCALRAATWSASALAVAAARSCAA
jgi:hypothetical protein